MALSHLRTFAALVILIGSSLPIKANELILSKAEALRQGYQPYKSNKPLSSASLEAIQERLRWPVKFADPNDPIGNTMFQYQPFGDIPYYHGGCDLVVANGEKVFTPVTGKVEAGHYSYVTNTDGSLTKFWKPWPANGEALYFEVSIVTDQYRFEFHHMNRDTLSTEVLNALKSGSGTLPAGTFLGEAVTFPVPGYTHVHYNIIGQKDVRYNPFFFSEVIRDSLAPEVSALFARNQGGKLFQIQNQISFRPSELIVYTSDLLFGGARFQHPPELLRLKQGSTVVSLLDFRMTLTGSDGRLPNLTDVYGGQFFLDGRLYRTEGGYGTGRSLIRIPTKNISPGPAILEIGDQAGNIKELNLNISY